MKIFLIKTFKRIIYFLFQLIPYMFQNKSKSVLSSAVIAHLEDTQKPWLTSQTFHLVHPHRFSSLSQSAGLSNKGVLLTVPFSTKKSPKIIKQYGVSDLFLNS